MSIKTVGPQRWLLRVAGEGVCTRERQLEGDTPSSRAGCVNLLANAAHPETNCCEIDARRFVNAPMEPEVRAWEARVTSDITGPPTSFGAYGPAWVEQRPISSRTRAHYRRLLTKHILPTFASMTLEDITPTAVATWYADTATHTPVTRIHAYAPSCRMRLARNLIEVNPCQEVDVNTSRRAEAVRPATAEEVDAIAAAMPARYQTLVLMAAWLAMPFSELGELRRKDIDLDANLVRVRRAVALIHGRFEVTTPKSSRGIRNLLIAPELLPRVTTHLREHVQPGREALLFPAVRDHDRHLSPSVLYPMFESARTAAGRPDLRVPDLRRSQNLLNGAPTGGGGPVRC